MKASHIFNGLTQRTQHLFVDGGRGGAQRVCADAQLGRLLHEAIKTPGILNQRGVTASPDIVDDLRHLIHQFRVESRGALTDALQHPPAPFMMVRKDDLNHGTQLLQLPTSAPRSASRSPARSVDSWRD